MIAPPFAPAIDRLAGRRVVVSISGGKDSAALSLHLRELGIEHERVFMDTGWEHPVTYEYLRGELARVLGPIHEIQAGRTMEELIRWKGMFPSRLRRFCTEELKVRPMAGYLRARRTEGHDVVCAVGIRHEESRQRAAALEWEPSDAYGCDVWQPLVRWTLDEVIAIHKRHDLRPNPLYLLGASSVGCWPCIFARKAELRLVADTDPERIARIRALEQELSDRAGAARAWFHSWGQVQGTAEVPYPPIPIDEAVAWSRTAFGGKQFEMFAPTNGDTGCVRWGLCDTGPVEAAP